MDCATITQATLYMTAVHASHLISLDWTGLPTAQKTDISRLRQLVLLTGYFYRSLCSHTQVLAGLHRGASTSRSKLTSVLAVYVRSAAPSRPAGWL